MTEQILFIFKIPISGFLVFGHLYISTIIVTYLLPKESVIEKWFALCIIGLWTVSIGFHLLINLVTVTLPVSIIFMSGILCLIKPRSLLFPLYVRSLYSEVRIAFRWRRFLKLEIYPA